MGEPAKHRYLIALGSNRRDRRKRKPVAVLSAAIAEIERTCRVLAVSPIVETVPLGPSRRRFANAAALLRSERNPPRMLAELKRIERAFGRRPGRRWGERVLDLDIVLWSGGRFESLGLDIPHPAFRQRAFVIEPAAAIAPAWRDPVTGRTLRQLAQRRAAPKPLDRRRHPL
ncbi:2-amino-4-hydroxy-6-hydroxymethyldihydropteridine diphosphokinase [Novosphingopyxis sp.]|uniref:2-amino-4-hydroxy-6- hydroxymethyldihydropteridine diphosphokinase n=1 Tax=Novosphingopyxis sp. TaxID=2709690 RepID=UPI003B5C8641